MSHLQQYSGRRVAVGANCTGILEDSMEASIIGVSVQVFIYLIKKIYQRPLFIGQGRSFCQICHFWSSRNCSNTGIPRVSIGGNAALLVQPFVVMVVLDNVHFMEMTQSSKEQKNTCAKMQNMRKVITFSLLLNKIALDC